MKEDSISGYNAWPGLGECWRSGDLSIRRTSTSTLYSSELSVSSCLSTFVWEVSRISPARNISSTTL